MFCCTCSSNVAIVAVVVPTVYLIWRYFQGGRFVKNVRIDGKIAIITGANAGLGKETAWDFARRGARVYMACRNVEVAREIREQIVRATNNENVYILKLDLSSLKSVRDFVADFKTRETRLDLLINNAGVMAIPERQLTVDGNEMQFGTNHLGHFLLTNLLLDLLKTAAPSRIVNLSSSGHYFAKFDRENLNSEISYSAFPTYFRTKLANVLFTRELARRLAGTGVTANSLHPGAVRTELQRQNWWFRVLLLPLMYVLFKTPRAGVQTQLAVALDPALIAVTGKYFTDCVVKTESVAAQSDDDAKWLWQQSEKMVNL